MKRSAFLPAGDGCSFDGGAPLGQTMPLDSIYTAGEMAARRRLTNRDVIKLGRGWMVRT